MKLLLLALALSGSPAPTADLTITPIVLDGQTVGVRTVVCQPGECPEVEKLKLSDFKIDKRKGCAQRYYGKEKIKVKGVFKGHKINITLSRQNGCQNKRYNKVLGVLASDLAE